MDATVDDVGRIVIPKPLRDRLRLTPGTKVDVSEYGDGLGALAARSMGLALASRDRRARDTYRLLGVRVELLG